MELETVGRVAVRHLSLEVGGQVDDMDGAKGTFLRADTATDTETLGDECDLGVGGDLNTQLARADYGARLLALLPTFLQGSVSLLPSQPGTQFVPLVYTVIVKRRGLAISTGRPWQRVQAGQKRRTLSLLTIATLKKLSVLWPDGLDHREHIPSELVRHGGQRWCSRELCNACL